MKEFLNKLKVVPALGYILFITTGLIVFFIAAFLVVFENKRYPEKNDGEILYQSISAGKAVEAGSKLYLTVNTGVDRVKMPDLKGQTLNNAKAALDKVLSGETYVTLSIGGITYIPVSAGQSPDTVVGQIPESYLVTQEGLYSFKVYYFETENKVQSGYEKISYKVDNTKPYKLQVQKLDDESITQNLFEDISFQKDEELKFVFYREGDVRVSLIGMDGDNEKSFKFRSEL